VGLISCERNLLPLGDKSPLCSDYSVNLNEFRHAQHSYISTVTNFGPLFYSFLHGFWYIDLTMAHKMGLPDIYSCVARDGTPLNTFSYSTTPAFKHVGECWKINLAHRGLQICNLTICAWKSVFCFRGTIDQQCVFCRRAQRER